MGIVFEYKVKNPQTKQEMIQLILSSQYLKRGNDSSGGEIYRRAIAGRFGRDVHVLRPPDAQSGVHYDTGEKVQVLASERLFLRLRGVIYVAFIVSYGNSRKGRITSRLDSIQHKVGRDDGATLKQIVKEIGKKDYGRVRDVLVGNNFGSDFRVEIKNGQGAPIQFKVSGPEIVRYPNTSGGSHGECVIESDYTRMGDLEENGSGPIYV